MKRSIASAFAAAMAYAASLSAEAARADQADPRSVQPDNATPDNATLNNTSNVEAMLRGMSIEELAKLPITTVAKHPQALNESAAAVFVLSREDIRRSGATSLPEVLRLAPNLEVAQLNGYTWSISARGFNSQRASNKLLVLVDGRSVIEPVGSSVLWQQVDVVLDEIDRIEVVSGPGGALWGAGAVNGVINIITRRASESRGALVDISGGGFKRTAQLRYGLDLNPDLGLKVYAQGFDQTHTRHADPNDEGDDGWRGAQGGFRLDGRSGPGGYTLQGDFYRNVTMDDQGSLWGSDVEARYNRPFADGASVEVMAYYARDERTAPALFERRETYDLQVQNNLAPLGVNAVVWGGEARVWRETYASQDILAFAKPTTDIVLGSVFAQDEVSLRKDLKLTLGMKLEESSYSGFEWLPNIRLAWTYRPGDLLWAAISRSVRTPDRVERELQAPGALAPSPDFTSEKLTAFEAGWRGQPTSWSSFSVSTYYNLYDDLRTDDLISTPNGPLVLTANGMRGETYGIEAWGKIEPIRGWRLNFGANGLAKHFKVKPGVDDISGREAGGQDPDWQAQIRSEANLTSWLEFDATVRSVARVEPAGAPGYTEGDARLAWRITRSLQLSADGRNLFNPRHLEAIDPFQALPARYIGRTFYVGLRWGF